MRLRARIALFACSAVALLALPATAGAVKPGYEVKPKQLSLSLRLPSTNGYSATVTTEGKLVTLAFSGNDTAAAYRVRGRVSPRRIEADFGSLGRISARLTGARESSGHLAARCTGRNSIDLTGSFRGHFQFSGEEGFAEVDTRAVRGRSQQDFRQVCKRRRHRGADGRDAGERRAGEPETTLTLVAAFGKSVSGARVAFEALGVEGEDPHGRPVADPGALVIAVLNEHREAVAIGRSALLFEAGPGILLSGPEVQPVTATVALPAPFAGTASLLKEGDSPATWSGDLSVSLPGAKAVPLTGPDFKAAFCRAAGDALLERCLAPFAEAEGRVSSAAPIPNLWARPGSPG